MKKYIFLCLLSSIIVLSGCSEENIAGKGDRNMTRELPEPRARAKNITIFGRPISVSYNAGEGAKIAVVLEANERKVLAHRYSVFTSSDDCLDASALVQSEILDGDDEEIELTGRYDEQGRFIIESIKANGHKIDFF